MKLKTISALFILGFCANQLFAQWNQTAPSGFRFGQTDRLFLNPNNWIKSVGVGNFTFFGDQPRAALHVNQFYLTNSTGFAPGEVFRTSGSNTNLNAWRLFTGISATTTTEKFSLFVPVASNNAFLQATSGDMYFNTASSTFVVQERMRITNGIGNLIGVQQPNATRVNISLVHFRCHRK